MKVLIINHAHLEIIRRQLSKEAVINVVQNPQQVIELENKRKVYQSKYFDTDNDKEMLLRVICEERYSQVLVITAYRTAKVDKYWCRRVRMKIIYNPDSDTLDILFKDTPVAESDELREGLIIDYDKGGKIVSVEVLNASEHIAKPQAIEYETRSRTKVK